MKTKAVKKKGSFIKQLKRDRSLWLFCLPGVVLTFIFSYIPMYGVQLAFRRYCILIVLMTYLGNRLAPWR